MQIHCYKFCSRIWKRLFRKEITTGTEFMTDIGDKPLARGVPNLMKSRTGLLKYDHDFLLRVSLFSSNPNRNSEQEFLRKYAILANRNRHHISFVEKINLSVSRA